METFIKTVLVMFIISPLLRLFLLAQVDYPRTNKVSRGEEALTIIVHTCFAIWAYSTLS